MENTRIQDIPTIKKLLNDIKAMKSIKAAMPFVGPLLRLIKVDVDQMNEALADIDDLERMVNEYAVVPDRFNDLFATRGWIIYDLMNVEVAKAAINKAEAGDIEGAEVDLVSYYDTDTVKWKLQTMIGVQAFRTRMPLAQKALEDYREGRYYASTLVILALLDGLVSELHEKRRGFSAQEVDMQAWDSIAAHEKGLTALAKIFQTGRRTTRTEEITIPYRHGIMHGMDLGYDNKIVAAKTWGALFAARDWALKVEKGLVKAPPVEPKRPVLEQLKSYAGTMRDIEDDKARLATWKPRALQIGTDVPVTGEPNIFESESPEQKLAEFLGFWRTRNYGGMAQCLPFIEHKYEGNKLPLNLKRHYVAMTFQSFEILEIEDEAPAITNIKVKLLYKENDLDVEKVKDFRLLYEDKLGNPSVRGKPGSQWVLYTSRV